MLNWQCGDVPAKSFPSTLASSRHPQSSRRLCRHVEDILAGSMIHTSSTTYGSKELSVGLLCRGDKKRTSYYYLYPALSMSEFHSKFRTCYGSIKYVNHSVIIACSCHRFLQFFFGLHRVALVTRSQ